MVLCWILKEQDGEPLIEKEISGYLNRFDQRDEKGRSDVMSTSVCREGRDGASFVHVG